MRLQHRIGRAGSVGVLVVILTSACSLGPEDLPSPRFGGGGGGGYPISIHFESALNLPTGADISFQGTRVGEVTALEVGASDVEVFAQIASDVSLPTDTSAAIRQNTLLGDTFIVLLPPESPSTDDSLESGAVIPLDRTSAPPQLEDTLAVMANFVNGGTVQQVQEVMSGINAVVPDKAELSAIATVSAVDLNDLAANTHEVDRLLEGMDATARSIGERDVELKEMLSDEAQVYWRRVADSILTHIAYLLPSIGSVFEGGMWLVPMLDSLAQTSDGIVGVASGTPQLALDLSRFLRETVGPFVADPAVDIASVHTSSGSEITPDVETLMRILGAVR